MRAQLTKPGTGAFQADASNLELHQRKASPLAEGSPFVWSGCLEQATSWIPPSFFLTFPSPEMPRGFKSIFFVWSEGCCSLSKEFWVSVIRLVTLNNLFSLRLFPNWKTGITQPSLEQRVVVRTYRESLYKARSTVPGPDRRVLTKWE